MAKQTFTTGQVLTAAQMTSLQQTAMLGGAASAKTASYVLVAADAGDAITMSNAGATTITANTGLFATGDIVTIINIGAGVCTITAGTATVTTSGSLVLAQNQGGVLRFTSPSEAIFLQFATPASGDIEGVTAGVGISGGGTSGTVTVTNSMATAIDAKGDLVPGTGADTFARLAVGANGTVLTADSAEATGLKWATASAAAPSFSLLSTTTLSGAATHTVTGLSGYTTFQIIIDAATNAGGAAPDFSFRINGDTGSNYNSYGFYMDPTGTWAIARVSGYNQGSTTGAKVAEFANLGGPSYLNGYFQIQGGNSTGVKTFTNAFGYSGTISNNVRGYIGGGHINNASVISSITFFSSGINFSGGSMRIYGSAV
jgi:hypothetical protein